MKFERKQLSDVSLELTLTLDAGDLSRIETEALAQLAPKTKVKGFRTGKAPLAAVKQALNPNALLDQTIELAINRFTNQVLQAEKIIPLDQPHISITKFVPDQSLEFKVTAEVLPQVQIPNYKKLKTKKASVKVDPKEVNDTLERVRKSFAKETEVKRAAKLGDKVVIDFEGFKNGVAFAGGKASDFHLELGSKQFIPGFEEGLVGKKAGQTCELKLSFPKDYHASDLKGQAVLFKVKIKKVLSLKLPELNDQLAKQTNMFASLAELTKDIEANLLEQRKQQAEQDFRNQLVDELASKTKTTIPETLKQDQVAALERETMQNLQYRGQNLDQYLETKQKTRQEWVKEDLEPIAEQRVRAGLALAELTKEFKIQVSEQELSEKIEQLKSQYVNNPDIIKQLSSPEAKRDLHHNLLTNKTIDRLVDFYR